MMIHFQRNAIFMMIIFFFLVGTPSMVVAGRHNQLMGKLFTSDEFEREAAGYGEEKISTVVVSGTLLCHSSYLDTKNSHPIPGASVSVLCHTERKRISKSNWVRGKTDEDGDFLIDLPSHLHAIPDLEKRCVVVILRVPKKSSCHRSTFKGKGKGKGKHTGWIKLSSSSSGNGIRTYSTHGIHLTHKHSYPHKGKKMVHMI